MQIVRHIVLFLTLLYTTIYIPLFSVTYFPHWYKLNCQWNDRCQRFGHEESVNCIDELVSFFRHTGELTHERWSHKEKMHMIDVRHIFDRLAFSALLAIPLLILTANRKAVRRLTIFNLIIILSLFAMLPFFRYFWQSIFHAIVFDNAYWRTNPMDVSYFIFPQHFFKHTMIFIISVAAAINGSMFMITSLLKKN
jgi:integral membrane protein (TIGR01906 family)